MELLRKLLQRRPVKIRPTQESFIDATSKSMKRVYWLTQALQEDPQHVEIVRALTLNQSKPRIGLKGTHGLFASSEWWNNINNRVIPLKTVSGIVVRVYEAGQDRTGVANTVQLRTADGSLEDVGIYINDKNDVGLFRAGANVELVYALDELKCQPARDGGVAYSKVALEMAVSNGPQSAG